MRFSLAALALTLAIATPAEARRGAVVTITEQKLEFVAPTQIPNGDGGTMALCSLVSDFSVMWIPLRRTIEGYALSVNDCAGEYFQPFDAGQLAQAKALGLIAQDIPATAKLSPLWTIWHWAGYAVLGLMGLMVLAGLLRKLRFLTSGGTYHGAKRPSVVAATRSIAAMCHVAVADGEIDPKEIDLIMTAAKRLTGRPVSHGEVQQMVQMAQSGLTDADFDEFGDGLNNNDRKSILRSALYMAIIDGRIDQAEYGFVTKLSHGLRIKTDEFRQMLDVAIADMQALPQR